MDLYGRPVTLNGGDVRNHNPRPRAGDVPAPVDDPRCLFREGPSVHGVSLAVRSLTIRTPDARISSIARSQSPVFRSTPRHPSSSNRVLGGARGHTSCAGAPGVPGRQRRCTRARVCRLPSHARPFPEGVSARDCGGRVGPDPAPFRRGQCGLRTPWRGAGRPDCPAGSVASALPLSDANPTQPLSSLRRPHEADRHHPLPQSAVLGLPAAATQAGTGRHEVHRDDRPRA